MTMLQLKTQFNELNRPTLPEKLLFRCPQVFPFMKQAYQDESPQFYRREKIYSETCLLQGDPIA